MRQILVDVDRGAGSSVMDLAKRHQGRNMAKLAAEGEDGERDLVYITLPNAQVGPFLGDLEGLGAPRATLLPYGVLPMHPPASELADQIKDVHPLSPLEAWLAGLQSISSIPSLLAYAAAAAAIVWVGMITDTIFLLVAAMLIAPFAGPAMNTAIATARGDGRLMGQSLSHYFLALGFSVLVAAALSWVWGQHTVTSTMVKIGQVSSVAVLLPLAAGAAGALNVTQSDRSNLVSGTASGVLVAASLSPPAGLVGMASAMGRWDLVQNAVFVLLLQLVAINFAGSLTFRWRGLTPSGPRYPRGTARWFWLPLVVTALGLGGLLMIQFRSTPDLQRSSLAQRAVGQVQQVVQDSGMAYLLEANARFTRADTPGQNTLLISAYVQPAGPDQDPSEVEEQLRRSIQDRVGEAHPGVTPLVEITVLQPPDPG